MDKDKLVFTDDPAFTSDIYVSSGRRTWKDAFKDKAVHVSAINEGNSRGYRILWYLWSADIWLGKFPLLKFILAANVVVWILQFVL